MKRLTLDFNDGFRFFLGDVADAFKEDFDDSLWQSVLIPHDWSIYGEFKIDNPTGASGGFRPAGIGWYRKKFFVPSEYKGSFIELEFDGIYRKPTVYINGKKAAYWVNGYINKRIDITPFLKYGEENTLAVRVDNSEQPSSRYYTGCGIYRDVKLYVRDFLYINNLAPFITTPNVSEDEATVRVETEICNSHSADKICVLNYKITDKYNNLVLEVKGKEQTVKAGDTATLLAEMVLNNPKLWDTEKPYLYTLTTEIFCDGNITDNSTTRFGVRSILFDREKGFILNGKHTYIKGVCLHHDNGALGAVSNTAADRRKLLTMGNMGANAIRLSHNPVANSFLDLCDEMGFLVMDEFFDEWKEAKNNLVPDENGENKRIKANNYHQYFDECWKEDLVTTVIRDRNHPSIVIYSIGNEIIEQRHLIKGAEKLAIMLSNKLKEYDNTRPVTAACCFDNKQAEAEPFCNYLDVAGYNYAEPLYAAHHKEFKDRTIIGSEDVSVVPFWKRGEYDLEVLSYINRTVEKSVGECLDTSYVRICSGEWSMRKHIETEFVSGFFIWTGIDYLGEPTPYNWPSRSSYFGAADTCCFPKDSYYFYKSFWCDEPVLHIFPHWNLDVEEGSMVDVIAYTNCERAELFLNGESKGVATYNPQMGEHLHWKVPYIKGELVAIGYDKDGNKTVTDRVYTADAPADIILAADRTALDCDFKDTAFITATLVDEKGHIVPTEAKKIEFFVDDGLRLEGVDNGDPEYTGDLKANSIPTLGGLALAIVSANGRSGSFKVTAKIDGLCSKTIEIRVKD